MLDETVIEISYHRRVNVTVRVWCRVAGMPRGLFTFAGAVDAAALRAVMQHVERLSAAAPGRWCVDVLAMGLDGPLLLDLWAALHDLRRSGQRARLALTPRRRTELRTRMAHEAVAVSTPSLWH
jgi:hypothetical protein